MYSIGIIIYIIYYPFLKVSFNYLLNFKFVCNVKVYNDCKILGFYNMFIFYLNDIDNIIVMIYCFILLLFTSSLL